jgi:hypothetical protein
VSLVEELIHHWYRELILGGLRVEGTVVDAESPELVDLAHQEDRGEERSCAGSVDPLGEHIRVLPFQLVLLQLG